MGHSQHVAGLFAGLGAPQARGPRSVQRGATASTSAGLFSRPAGRVCRTFAGLIGHYIVFGLRFVCGPAGGFLWGCLLAAFLSACCGRSAACWPGCRPRRGVWSGFGPGARPVLPVGGLLHRGPSKAGRPGPERGRGRCVGSRSGGPAVRGAGAGLIYHAGPESGGQCAGLIYHAARPAGHGGRSVKAASGSGLLYHARPGGPDISGGPVVGGPARSVARPALSVMGAASGPVARPRSGPAARALAYFSQNMKNTP